MGITSPYPRENIIAGNYILADTQAFLSKCHRQQNKEILIRHSPGIGGCFLFLSIQLTEKIKNLIKEAAAYFNIGIKKLRRIAEDNLGTVAVYCGNRFLIIRPKFEEFILNSSEI